MKKLFVYDIDGTVANNDPRAHMVTEKPKDWKAFFEGQMHDVPHHDILWTLHNYYDQGHTIVFCTGRDDSARDVTLKWFAQHDIPYDGLYMRKFKDYRDDSIIKVELLQQIRKDFAHMHDDVFLWFDDRQRVVDAIRAQGVRVLQVQPGDF